MGCYCRVEIQGPDLCVYTYTPSTQCYEIKLAEDLYDLVTYQVILTDVVQIYDPRLRSLVQEEYWYPDIHQTQMVQKQN